MGRLLTAAAPAVDPSWSAAGGARADIGTLDGLRELLRGRGEDLVDYSRVELLRGRNTTVTLVRQGGDGILVKQHRPRAGMRYDAERTAHLTTLRPYAQPGQAVSVPQLLEDEPGRRILVFDLVPAAVTLGERLRRARRLSRWTMTAIGRFVGDLHRDSLQERAAGCRTVAAIAEERRQLPSYTEIGPEAYATFSGGERRLACALQRDRRLGRAIDLLAATIAPSCQIHGDLRPENILLRQGSPRDPVVIDWELTRFSDPAIELGYFVGCLVDGCLSVVRAPSVEAWLTRARASLQALERALRAWWDAYREAAAPLAAGRPALPILVMSHAGCTIVGQIAGRAQEAGALTARDWLVLRFARQLLLDPFGAARRCLGTGAAHA